MVQRMVIIASAILLVHVIIGAGFMFNNRVTKKDNNKLITELENKWMTEDEDRKAWQEEQLQEKLGTSKLDRIVYDPRLDVRLAYQKLFDEVMDDYLVEVEMDRFDELSIFINTYSMQKTYKLTTMLKKSMP